MVAAGLIALVVNTRSDSAATAATADRVDRYTDELRALSQKVSPAATAMAALATDTSKATLAEIEDGAPAWRSSLVQGQAAATSTAPPPEISEAHGLFVESIQLYSSAAATFELVLEADAKQQSDILATAAETRGHAETVWAAGVAVVDGELADLGAGPSGLRPPSTPGVAAPGAATDGGGGKDGGGGQGAGNGGGQGGDKGGNGGG